jgi:hypothetical protein
LECGAEGAALEKTLLVKSVFSVFEFSSIHAAAISRIEQRRRGRRTPRSEFAR